MQHYKDLWLLLVLLSVVGANVDVYIKADELNRTIGMLV